MNAKQIRFVQEYLIDFNATRAYIAAGYAGKHSDAVAYRMLQNPEIKKAIEEGQKETAQKLLITKEQIIQDLIDIKNNTKDSEKFSNNAIKALEVINKMLGFNEPDKIQMKADVLNKTVQITYKKKDGDDI